MEVRRESAQDAVVYRLSGKLDAVTSPNLDTTIAVPEDGPRVILDMRAVTYMSSAGLKGIVRAVRRIQSAKGSIAIFGLQALVRDVFDAAGLANIMTIAADEAEARAKLGA